MAVVQKTQIVSLLQVFLLYQLPMASTTRYNWYRRHRFTQESSNSPFQATNPSNMCTLQRPSDILRILPGRFLSDDDLMSIIPEPNIVSFNHKPTYTRVRTIKMRRFNTPTKPGDQVYINDGLCGCCSTEIGYEVIEQITDFQGRNHTIINFNNNFQFIPTGRCVNPEAPCGGGDRARCKQVTRAHWSLVWTSGVGVQLVSHEVPSHCQCLNIGTRSARTNAG